MGSRRAGPPWLSPLQPGRSRRRTRPRAHLLAAAAVAALLAAVALDVVSALVAGAAGLLLAAVTVLARHPF